MTTTTERIKARRHYYTRGCPELGVNPERVYVTGWADVECGIKGSEQWPHRVERWCRVRFDGDKVSKVLVHPNELTECPA